MTVIQRLDEALRANGWSYDLEEMVFRNRGRQKMRHSRILALVPGMTEDEIASYQDYHWAKRMDQRAETAS